MRDLICLIGFIVASDYVDSEKRGIVDGKFVTGLQERTLYRG